MKTETITSNTFERVLRNQRKGAMAADLSDKLAELTRACQAHGKAGKLILTLKLTPTDGEGAAVMVFDDIEIKAPKATKPNSIFFTTEDGQLLRDDPNQKELELKVVPPQPTAEPTVVQAAS